MIRRSIFVTTLITLVSLVALGYTLSGPATGTAEASLAPPPAPVQSASCPQPTITIKHVALQGARPRVNAAKVDFEIARLDPCFKISNVEVKITFSNAQGDTFTRTQNVTNANVGANSVVVPLSSIANLAAVFRLGQPVNHITFARVTAAPVAQTLTGTNQIAGSF